MTSKEHTQKRILNIVEVYKKAFPEEYKAVCDGLIMSRQLLADEMGTVKGEHSGASAQRVLYEIPEKLYQSIHTTLDGEELNYFKSKEGGRWFTKAVPQFALAKL
jgi:hypothetical protein